MCVAIVLDFADAGWSSSVARRAHNPKVIGSNPVPATQVVSHGKSFMFLAFASSLKIKKKCVDRVFCFCIMRTSSLL